MQALSRPNRGGSLNRTRKKVLNKQDLYLILQEILYDVVDLANGDCEDPIATAKDINYGLNVVVEQIYKYYKEVEE